MPADEPRVSLDTLQIIHLFSQLPCFHLLYPLSSQKLVQQSKEETRKQWSPVLKCYHSQKGLQTL